MSDGGEEVQIVRGSWRIATLIGVHVFFIAHFVRWKVGGHTLAPLEFNEVMYTIRQGIVTAGFILMALVMVATFLDLQSLLFVGMSYPRATGQLRLANG